jgi:hypothetical protein
MTLAEMLLRDREKHAERERLRAKERSTSVSVPQACGFNPYTVTAWNLVAGTDPGGMPTTPMQMGAVGFWINCRCCGERFESKGLGYCAKCRELPAEERRNVAPGVVGRICLQCGQALPYRRRAGAMYCSSSCNQAAKRQRLHAAAIEALGVPDNRAQRPDSLSADFVPDEGEKPQ